MWCFVCPEERGHVRMLCGSDGPDERPGSHLSSDGSEPRSEPRAVPDGSRMKGHLFCGNKQSCPDENRDHLFRALHVARVQPPSLAETPRQAGELESCLEGEGGLIEAGHPVTLKGGAHLAFFGSHELQLQVKFGGSGVYDQVLHVGVGCCGGCVAWLLSFLLVSHVVPGTADSLLALPPG